MKGEWLKSVESRTSNFFPTSDYEEYKGDWGKWNILGSTNFKNRIWLFDYEPNIRMNNILTFIIIIIIKWVELLRVHKIVLPSV